MLKGIFEILTKGVAARWAEAGPVFRWATAGMALVLVLSAVRLGLLGGELQRMSRIVVPVHIPVLDGAATPGRLLVRAEIAGPSGGWVDLVPGDACPSGSRVRLRLEVTGDGWLTAMGVSAAGRYPVLESGFAPVAVAAGSRVEGGAELDAEVGTEIFAALYSARPFTEARAEALRLSHADAVAAIAGGRGGAVLSGFGPLPGGMVGSTTYCRHVD